MIPRTPGSRVLVPCRDRGAALLLILCLIALAGLIGLFVMNRAGRSKAATAEEFVEKYSQAWARKDVSTIFKMQASSGIVDLLDISPELKQAIRRYDDEKEKENIRMELKRRGMWGQAWAATLYSRERLHGDHIHVEVTVRGIPSEIVLVRAGRDLKVVSNPSLFDSNAPD